MSKKNFKVATDNGQTPTQDTKHAFATTNIKKDKTPTSKVKTLKDKEETKKAREEQYKNFRVKALTRRAKRMGLTEEQIKVKIEQLLKQLSESNDYNILIMFNPEDKDMLKQGLANEDLAYKIMGENYAYVVGDQEVLDIIRGFKIPSAKIFPYVKRKPPILPVQQPSGRGAKKRTKAEKKALAKAAKASRKKAIVEAFLNRKKHSEMRKAENNKKKRALKKAQMLFKKRTQKAEKAKGGTTVQLKPKKASESPKTASTNVKKAA